MLFTSGEANIKQVIQISSVSVIIMAVAVAVCLDEIQYGYERSTQACFR